MKVLLAAFAAFSILSGLVNLSDHKTNWILENSGWASDLGSPPRQYVLPTSPSCNSPALNSRQTVSAWRNQPIGRCDDLIRAVDADLRWHVGNAEASCRYSGGQTVWGEAVQTPASDCEKMPGSLRVARSMTGVCVDSQQRCVSIESPSNSAACPEDGTTLWSHTLSNEKQSASEQACEASAGETQTALDSEIQLKSQQCISEGGLVRVHRRTSPEQQRCDGMASDGSWLISRSAVLNCCKASP